LRDARVHQTVRATRAMEEDVSDHFGAVEIIALLGDK
jgi:hypothetical protein